MALNWILFLGTGGGRVVTSKQFRQTGGFIVSLESNLIWFDPGPGALVHARRLRFPVEDVNYIVISHNHLDHVNDVNVVTEAITLRGYGNLTVLAPSSTFSENVLYSYLHERLKQKVELDNEVPPFKIGELQLTWFQLEHTTLTYGFSFIHNGKKLLTYISDTAPFDKLSEYISGTSFLIINVLFPYRVNIGKHLSIPDLEDVVRKAEQKPRRIVITHLGGRYIHENLRSLSEELSMRLQADIKFAKDNWIFFPDGHLTSYRKYLSSLGQAKPGETLFKRRG